MRLADHRRQHRPGRHRQRVEVVTALEHHDGSPGRHERLQADREVGEVGGGQFETGERIVAVGVEAGGDEQPVGAMRLDDRGDEFVERLAIHVAARAGREGQVAVRHRCVRSARLAGPPGSGVERRLVRRHVQHTLVVVEDVLGAVAVVHVPVDDGHPLATRGELGRRHGDAVEEAESHRPVGHRVMPGRPAGGERDVALAGVERGDGVEHRTDRTECRGPRSGHDGRVGVEVATTGGTELLEPIHVAGRVHALDVVDARRWTVRAQFERTVESRRGHAGESRLDPSAPLGMPRRRQVLVEVGAGEDVDGSGHGVTLRTPAGRHPTGSHHRRPPRRCDAGIMPSPAEPSPWESTVVLGNGDVAVIRPLTPHDREALATFHRRQSKDSIYRRYFSPKPELTERDLDHFTNVDMTDRVALAVESHGDFIAWSSYERWPGRSEAEAAFMVDDAHQGEGVATLMLEHLAAIARSNGIDRFTAEVLADNRPMLAVFAKAGWPLQRRFDSGVVDLDWELATTDEFLDSVERREQRADSRAVVRLLIPRAIAVIGASDRAGSVGAAIWDSVTANTTVPVHAVNPARTSLGGRPCHATVADLPDDVTLAVVAVPARHLDETIDACIAKRMRGADRDHVGRRHRRRRHGDGGARPVATVCASSGRRAWAWHRPRPDQSLQAALVRVTLPVGHVAISMQSGSLASSLLRRARDLDLGISWFVSLGDKADVSANDLLQFWEEDTNTRVVAMYTESFGNPRKFARIARRVSRTMPIVAVRTGSASVGAAERARCTSRPASSRSRPCRRSSTPLACSPRSPIPSGRTSP